MCQTKLSKKQKIVMKWLGQGWSAQILRGSLWGINGEYITCKTATLESLESQGLVIKENPYSWKATDKGRLVTKDLVLAN